VRRRKHSEQVSRKPLTRAPILETDDVAVRRIEFSQPEVHLLRDDRRRVVALVGSSSASPSKAALEVDLLDGLKRIGIDEISHRRGQRYLTVVVCHDTGRLVWAAPGRDRKTVEAFLDQLGKERCKQVELVSCDMASWISGPVAERLPGAGALRRPVPRRGARDRRAG
jgi:transposase